MFREIGPNLNPDITPLISISYTLTKGLLPNNMETGSDVSGIREMHIIEARVGLTGIV